MNKTIIKNALIMLISSGTLFTSCKKDDPEPVSTTKDENPTSELTLESYLIVDNTDTIPFKSLTRSYSDSTRTIYQSNFEKGDTLISLVYTTISEWAETKTYTTKDEGIYYDPSIPAKEDTMHIALNDFSGPWNDADSQLGHTITITKTADNQHNISFDNVKFKQQWGDESLINLSVRIKRD